MAWISVEDNMPRKEIGDLSINVLVYTSTGTIWSAFFDYNDSNWKLDFCNDTIYGVTHWTGYPDPPKQ